MTFISEYSPLAFYFVRIQNAYLRACLQVYIFSLPLLAGTALWTRLLLTTAAIPAQLSFLSCMALFKWLLG
jgi:hypothetical protein